MQLAFDRRDPVLLKKALDSGACPDQAVSSDSAAALPALDLAIRLGLTEHVRLLLHAGAAIEPEAPRLVAAVTADTHSLPILTLLLQAGADPNSAGGLALFTALDSDDEAAAQLRLSRLLEYGGQISAANHRGCSLLELALQKEFRQLSCTLINAGAPLPPGLDQLDCSDELKALARRWADDVAIRRMLQGH